VRSTTHVNFSGKCGGGNNFQQDSPFHRAAANAFELPGTAFNVPERFYFRRNGFISSGTVLFLREQHFLRRERFYFFWNAFISSETSFEASKLQLWFQRRAGSERRPAPALASMRSEYRGNCVKLLPMMFRAVFLALMLVLFARPGSAVDGVTFNNQVVRILQQHCQTCHRPGNIAPFSLLSYSDALEHASAMKHAVQMGEMPPWKPENSHGIFLGERSLSGQEIETITAWVESGAPEGDASDLPEPLRFPDAWSAGTPDKIIQPSSAYPVGTGSDDVYRCFPITVDSTNDLYVRGYEVLPGNRAIVHHVLLFTDEAGQSVSLDEADPGPGYTCFGGAGFLSGLGALGGWAPGASPQIFPLGTGVRMAKGTRIVLQIHYSLAEFSRSSSGPPAPDLTRVGLYFSSVPLQRISFLPVVNPFFSIPAGDSHYQVKATLPIFTAVELVAIAPHMHLLGREATVEARFPNGERRQLIRIDDWDFHWQGNYTYREPITLPAGTIIEMTAYYDNSLNNPENPSNPPVNVRWGERTTDEMCV
jgi:hypothetical protein